MRLHRQTPWARREMSAELRRVIEATEPKDHLVSIGRSTNGWTCRILTPDLHLVAENYGAGTMDAAFAGAKLRLEATRAS